MELFAARYRALSQDYYAVMTLTLARGIKFVSSP